MNLTLEQYLAFTEAASLITECSKHFSDARYTQQTLNDAIAGGNIPVDSLPAINQFLKTLLDGKGQPPNKTDNASHQNSERGRATEERIALLCVGLVGIITRGEAAALIAPKINKSKRAVENRLSEMFPGDLWDKGDSHLFEYISKY
jgi:hypothetical protein